MRSMHAAKLLAAAACAGALVWRCAQPVASAATVVRTSALGTFPRESVALLVLEVKALRDQGALAAWMHDLASGAEKQEALKQIKARFGPQIIDKLDRLALAIVPIGGSRMGYGVIAEGAYDEAALREAIGGQTSLTLLEIDGQPDLSVTVLKGGTLVLGPRVVLDGVRVNADRRGAGLDANTTLMDLLAAIRPTAQAWGAIDYKPLASLTHGLSESKGIRDLSLPTTTATDTLVALSFQATLDARLELELMGRTDAESSARNLADTVRGFVALARMGAGQDQAAKEWLEILDAIGIDQKGAQVVLHASIPEQTISDLAGRMASASAHPPAVSSGPPSASTRPIPGPASIPGSAVPPAGPGK